VHSSVVSVGRKLHMHTDEFLQRNSGERNREIREMSALGWFLTEVTALISLPLPLAICYACTDER
jgi:hypothetical protein